MKTINATNLRKDIYKVLKNTIRYNDPITISSRDGDAVLLSKDDYDDIQETLYLLSIPGMHEKLLEAKEEPLSECVPAEEVFGAF